MGIKEGHSLVQADKTIKKITGYFNIGLDNEIINLGFYPNQNPKIQAPTCTLQLWPSLGIQLFAFNEDKNADKNIVYNHVKPRAWILSRQLP
jgi:hypothetical protein